MEPASGVTCGCAVGRSQSPERRHQMRHVWLPLLLTLVALLGGAGAPTPGSGQESRVYAVWPHSDYKPWQADIYARDPDFVLRELDWMRGVGITTYLPLALA